MKFSFRVSLSLEALKKSWSETYTQLSFICAGKYLNQRVIGEWVNRMEKEKKEAHKEIEFHSSIQIWILTVFTGCRDVVGKMPGL